MQDDFSLESYDFFLPQDNIAQHPSEKRDDSKILVLQRKTEEISHKHFSEITEYFQKGDILVVNDTKVFPARLLGKKTTGGKVEIFLLGLPIELRQEPQTGTKKYAEATALVKSSKRPATGSEIYISEELQCKITEQLHDGKVKVRLAYSNGENIVEILSRNGSVPLPPYIERSEGTTKSDRERYQTVYARNTGAIAAPTAGLHFTQSIFDRLKAKGVEIVFITLHVGYGTFAPVRVDSIEEHQIHSEYIEISEETAAKINAAKNKGGKVWAVGTTTVRALEFSSNKDGLLLGTKGWCDLYIIPGYSFSIVDNLITNFHLPKSSLLFLVSALCGRGILLRCYRNAIEKDYRFYSYGDAMAIIS